MSAHRPPVSPSLAPLSTVFSIPQVAKMAGWTRQRMARHLKTKHRELNGGLLVDVGTPGWPRWTITLAALQAIAPQWFHDPESLQRQIDEQKVENEDLRFRLRRLELIVEMHTQRLASEPRARPALRQAG